MKNSLFFPVLLIAIGTALLLNQFNLVEFTRPYIFIALFTFIGLALIHKAFMLPTRKGLLGGSFFLLLAIAMTLMDMGYLPIYDNFVVPVIFVDLGLANIIFYIFTRKSFSNITFGLIFIAAAAPFLVMHYTTITYWEIADVFSTYWPVLIITAGFGFLIDGMLKKAK